MGKRSVVMTRFRTRKGLLRQGDEPWCLGILLYVSGTIIGEMADGGLFVNGDLGHYLLFVT